jgi:hypothetical protein
VSSGIPEGKLKLGKALLAGGLITRELLESELERTQKTNSRMAKALLSCNFPSEDDLVQIIARSIRVPNVRLSSLKAAPEVVAEIPKELAKKYKVLALEKIGGLLVVVTPDLGNNVAFAAVRQETGCFVAPIRCPEEGFLDTIETFYKDVKPKQTMSATGSQSGEAGSQSGGQKAQQTSDPARRDPDAMLAIPAHVSEINGSQASPVGYYNLVSLWEHRYTGEGPVLAETVE